MTGWKPIPPIVRSVLISVPPDFGRSPLLLRYNYDVTKHECGHREFQKCHIPDVLFGMVTSDVPEPDNFGAHAGGVGAGSDEKRYPHRIDGHRI